MASLPSVSQLNIDDVAFCPTVKPPGSSSTLFLGGAGVRGLEIQGKLVKFTAIGIYLGGEALTHLVRRWKGKTADDLNSSVDFFRDIVTGPFEKFMRVTMILPLTGQQYSEKVTENCVAYWKAAGIYTEAEAMAVEKFKQVFKDENFPPNSSILFTLSPLGSLTIAFSKDSTVPEESNAIIENRAMAEAVLESMVGQYGVSPAAKLSLAERIAELLKEIPVEKDEEEGDGEKANSKEDRH
ncbi:chalcone--flavanone isomerase [Aristolochia californica]|uniref:chalcone--flavanone isomerase n=1 Tax=Aristolochia californica TaxID=171875 RepID=UPI0035E1A9ED